MARLIHAAAHELCRGSKICAGQNGIGMELLSFDQNRALDVVSLGRVTVDLNPVDMFKTLAESTTFRKYLGGSPANIAVGLARLGKKVGFIGKISDDRFGTFVSEYFKNEGIDTSHLTAAENGESMGLTFTEILSEQESEILMFRGNAADLSLELSDIDEEYIKNTKVLLISGTSLSRSPSREAALKALALAKKNDTFVVFDIDYRQYTWKNKEEIAVYYAIMGQRSDMIIGSREEFDLMQGLLARDQEDNQIAERWIKYGNKIIIIKHGKHGATLFTADGGRYKMTPYPVKKLKGFGGGDAFASAFLFCLLEGRSFKEALDFSNASASLLVASHSCSDAMPDAAAIEAFIRKGKSEFGEMVVKE